MEGISDYLPGTFQRAAMLLVFLAMSISFPAHADQAALSRTIDAKRQTVEATQFRQDGFELITSAAATAVDRDLRDLPRARLWRPGDPVREYRQNAVTKYFPEIAPLNKPAHKLDPLLERQARALRFPHQRAFATPLLSFPAQDFSGAAPPDTGGDIGVDYYVQTINSSGGSDFAVYNKADGSLALAPTKISSLAVPGSLCASQARGDPVIVFDSLAQRWVMSEFTGLPLPNPPPYALCVNVSQSSDPITGGWYHYQFVYDTVFPDYPKYGVWPAAYVVTTNEPDQSGIYALERAKMLAGEPAMLIGTTLSELPNLNGFQAFVPADADGPLPPGAQTRAIVMRHRDDEVTNPASNDPARDFLELFTFSVDWSDIANSVVTGPENVPIAEFDTTLCGVGFPSTCMTQPNGQPLWSLREMLMWRLQYRNFGARETLVGNMVTDARDNDDGGIRWFQLQRDNGADWAVFHEGTYAPDGNDRWMGSIAMDVSGNLALGYSESGITQVPTVSYTGRLAGDDPGALPQGENTLFDGVGSQLFAFPGASSRWGDYSAMTVDPVDGCTFWYTNEIAKENGAWRTAIGSFRFDSCGQAPGYCGDGVVAPGESCDDGNGNDGDGCSASCEVELGYGCTTPMSLPLEVVFDGDFEGGRPNDFWIESASNGDALICDPTSCDLAGAASGDYWAWFGGNKDGEAEWTVSQYVTIPPSAVSLSFQIRLQQCGNDEDEFTLSIDDAFVPLVFPGSPDCGEADYRTLDIDLATAAGGPYNDGGAHRLRWHARTDPDQGVESNFFLDNVRLIGAQERPSVCTARAVCFAEDFDPGVGGNLAALGWQSIPATDATLNWGTTDDGVCGSGNGLPGNFTDGFGEAACIDSDAFGGGEQAALLCSPQMSFAAVVGATLDFNYNYQVLANSGEDTFAALVGTSPPSPDAIDTYQPVFIQADDAGGQFAAPGVDQSIDISQFDGAPGVWACLFYRGSFDWYAQVDDIAVTALSCPSPDADADGVADDQDNCLHAANADQRDTDNDGFGNLCDADLNDDCIVNAADLGLLRSVFFSGDPDADFDGDGIVNIVDLGLFRLAFFGPPGASGVPNGCSVEVFYDETLWAARLAGNTERLDTTAANLALATQVIDPPSAGAPVCGPPGQPLVECALSFESFNTGLCHGFELRATQGISFDDPGLNAPPGVLSIGTVGAAFDDDVDLRALGGSPIEGIGFHLIGNDSADGESIQVLGEDGQLLRTLDAGEIPLGSSFLGFVSQRPIDRIFYDEDGAGDDIGLRDFVLDNCR